MQIATDLVKDGIYALHRLGSLLLRLRQLVNVAITAKDATFLVSDA
jgi:hypothetical protein